jgi:hypothetical protein
MGAGQSKSGLDQVMLACLWQGHENRTTESRLLLTPSPRQGFEPQRCASAVGSLTGSTQGVGKARDIQSADRIVVYLDLILFCSRVGSDTARESHDFDKFSVDGQNKSSGVISRSINPCSRA